MQVGYKVEECNHKDCPYRTEPITNADHIRSMSDEEFSCFLALVENRKTGKTSIEDTSDMWLQWQRVCSRKFL